MDARKGKRGGEAILSTMKKSGFVLIPLFMLQIQTAAAEYRAFMLEVYDHVSKKVFPDVCTGFSPDKYILTHGGGNRHSVIVKATWQCHGDTSISTVFEKVVRKKWKKVYCTKSHVCPMPPPIDPRFKVGDKVTVKLEKHITEGWSGTVELVYYQRNVLSNVCGVRFGKKNSVYQKYYQRDLVKAVLDQPANSGQPVSGAATQ